MDIVYKHKQDLENLRILEGDISILNSLSNRINNDDVITILEYFTKGLTSVNLTSEDEDLLKTYLLDFLKGSLNMRLKQYNSFTITKE